LARARWCGRRASGVGGRQFQIWRTAFRSSVSKLAEACRVTHQSRFFVTRSGNRYSSDVRRLLLIKAAPPIVWASLALPLPSHGTLIVSLPGFPCQLRRVSGLFLLA